MEADNYIDKTFNIVDQHLRCASIANIGKSALLDKKCGSWIGGNFLGLSEESWPESENGPMLPLLQIRVSELPFVPDVLKKIQVLSVFIDQQQPPKENPSVNGTAWRIRTYDYLKDLEPLVQPETSSSLKLLPIRWDLTPTEGPTWGDAQALVEEGRFFDVRHSIILFHERYKVHPGTKVGGWPGWVQESLADPEGFVMQIASEGKANWSLGDDGKCYVFNRNGEWLLYWDGF